MAKKVQYTTNTPSSSTDYLAADNTWKAMTGGGGGVPYTGATADVDLGTHSLTADSIGIGISAGAEKLHIDGGASTTRVKIDADNGVSRILSFRTDDVQRWALRVDGTESGSNSGADFQVRRYNDAGAHIDNPIAINRATGNVTTNTINGATATEVSYLSGVTSSIQTQINSKQSTITGAASTITSSNLTTYRALVSDGGGKVAVAATTSNEIGYLSGVTSNIQTQLNSKSSVSKSFLVGNFGSSAVSAGGTLSGGFVKSNLSTIGNEFQMRTIMPSACTFRNFTANVGAQPATGSLVLTMRIDAVDTAYTLTIAAGSGAPFTFQNTSTSLSVPNMASITFKLFNNAGSTSGPITAVSVMVEI